MLRIVAATRHDQVAFQRDTFLGLSLSQLISRPGVCAEVVCRNSSGLPEVFNAAIARAQDGDMIVFTHDDVWLEDWFLPERLTEALARFAVVGVAGNRRRVPRQPAWHYPDPTIGVDARDNLSGAIGHRRGSQHWISYYGEPACRVRLLDGVFLAAQVARLRQAGVRFDPRFRFHFYDLDFCRACEQAGLELGTWPIAVSHASVGDFRSPEWHQAYAEYLAKWKE
jgi:GT2 family glycosyltransferase